MLLHFWAQGPSHLRSQTHPLTSSLPYTVSSLLRFDASPQTADSLCSGIGTSPGVDTVYGVTLDIRSPLWSFHSYMVENQAKLFWRWTQLGHPCHLSEPRVPPSVCSVEISALAPALSGQS